MPIRTIQASSLFCFLGIAFLTISLFPGLIPQAQATEPRTNQTICVEPFCTYAPPKLTGRGMAEATRNVLKAAHHYPAITYPKPPSQNDKDFLDDFITNRNLTFLDPTLVVENIDDQRIAQFLNAACIYNLTHGGIKAHPTSTKGPLLIFDLGSAANNQHYIGAFIFGFDHDEYVDEESKIRKSHDLANFVLITGGPKCEKIDTFPLNQRGKPSSRGLPYTPHLAGLVHYKGQLIAYEWSRDSRDGGLGRNYYYFHWQILNITKPVTQPAYALAIMDYGQESPFYDPTPIINRQEILP
jgi:hypothetical protein